MKNKMFLGIMALFIISMTVTGAMAFRGPSEEAKTAMQSNDYEGWKTAMTNELTEERFNKHRDRFESRETMRTAIENNDYDAWKEVVGDRPVADVITEENFSQLVEMHNARISGDEETAKAIAEELGIEKNDHGKNGQGRNGGKGHGKMGGCPMNEE